MLIDASHPEETRVVVLRGNRVEEFDFESASKKQLRGNIYLAKVTRVEPSLQAAFVDYGGNRHGFLAFSEIHPDYYQIPVADRQALLEDEARAHAQEEEDDNNRGGQRRTRRHRSERSEKRRHGDERVSEHAHLPPEAVADAPQPGLYPAHEDLNVAEHAQHADAHHEDVAQDVQANEPPYTADHGHVIAVDPEGLAVIEEHDHDQPTETAEPRDADEAREDDAHHARDTHAPEGDDEHDEDGEEEVVEQLGGDAMEELPNRAPRSRRQYKIQEVIKRRQVLLVQVVKEERGNKGAALTTYLSLAGRYSVLMPNTARGGGISRKITDASDRKRLKEIAGELEVPQGMGVILRTAGASRTRAEVKRDFEYLMRMWETVREVTLESSAPTLVYEEGSLIKRSIRDLYNKEIDEVLVAGDVAFKEAKEFMRLLMPSHAKNVQLYRDVQPIFAKSGAEAQLDAMFSNQVTLRSGGYLVINQTEALVAIDVNSGRSTREHNIEDTALRTNLEAADEVARQLRLRDLAGLVVVDFIDMEENRNNRAVERRVKEALKNDRARIQVGRISHFGLLEMSRQRMRTGVLEGSTVPCPHCMGSGMVRSTASIALHVLRVLEDTLIKSSAHNITVRTRTEVALYMLNQKRAHLHDLEERFGVIVTVGSDDTLTGAAYHALERGDIAVPPPGFKRPELLRTDLLQTDLDDTEEDLAAEDESDEDEEIAEAMDSDENGNGDIAGESEEAKSRRRRRRRRRGRGGAEGGERGAFNSDQPQPTDSGLEMMARVAGDIPGKLANATLSDGETDGTEGEEFETEENVEGETGEQRRRRRSRRGGRNRRRERGDESAPRDGESAAAQDGGLAEVTHAVSETAAPVEERSFERPAPPVWTPPPPPAPAPVAATPAPAVEAPVRTIETLPEAPVDPNAPKKSGWWQRAKLFGSEK